MMLLGFAHKPVALPGANLELAAYTLPDGAQPVLCLHDANDEGSHGVVIDRHCDACALTHAPGLLAPQSACIRAPAVCTLAAWNDRRGQFAPATVHAPISRGPPFRLLPLA